MFEGCGMDLWNEAKQSGINEGIRKGRKEGREKEFLRGRRNFAKAILTLSGSLHAPLEQAMDLLKVPASEREEFLALIGKIQERKRLH